jgi:hypothetical protein
MKTGPKFIFRLAEGAPSAASARQAASTHPRSTTTFAQNYKLNADTLGYSLNLL